MVRFYARHLFVSFIASCAMMVGIAAAQSVGTPLPPIDQETPDGFRQYEGEPAQPGVEPQPAVPQFPQTTPRASVGDAIDPLLAPRTFPQAPPDPSQPFPQDALPDTAQPAAPGIDGLLPLTSVEIDWRVENPFRFFADAKDTEVHRATYLSLSPEQREAAPVLASEHALARRHEAGWAETMYRKTCWAGRRNRHVCPDKSDYVNPDRHRVIVSLKGMTEPNVDCRWITSELGPSPGAESAVTRPCGEPMTFSAPYPAGIGVRVEVGGITVASTEIKVRDIFVVGIGDSFGSGEGNPDVPVRFSPERTVEYGKGGGADDLTGYPARAGPWKQVGDDAFVEGNARWLDQACHRSLYSYQVRAALELAVEDPHRAVTFAGFACSGAEVTWGLFLRYKGNEWVPNPPDLSQISAAADAQCGKRDAPVVDMPEAYHMNGIIPELQGGLTLSKCPPNQARKIDLVLLSVGGNDIGFARLVANAVLSDESLVRNLGGWFGQVHGNKESQELLTRLDQRYKAMNRAIHGILHVPWDESDRVILTSYPPFALLDDQGNMCRDGSAGMEVFSEFKITQKAALSSSWLADKLDQIMKKSAELHGWTFAEDHRKTFVGRGLCAGHTNGLGPLVDDLRLPRRHDGVWKPYNPAHYEPYAARLRWFRTPNDAFLTGNFHVAGSVVQKVLKLQSFSWFQVLLASTYSGAFHPTAEGHAAIADSVVLRARAVLQRHGQQSAAVATPDTETP
ncbi:hypothetical protein [Hyphomicrobium sp.]|uniref:hypothetical protein n=1 Tax=Hyphomicrobium sp. TaxID=82 RepID=UPI002E3140BC|nr:hypothetical protein [Hyphomicrobium sp.]HEX2843553.1 hypothetical protein [Hyphomicrobium sp.]